MGGFLAALSLLTRVPAAGTAERERAVPWLPVVGVLVGAACAGVYAGAFQVLPPAAAATLAVGFGILLTGALHEDGLADVADAFGARVDPARTLEIMKDPHHGTYGILAVALSVVARVAAVSGMDVAVAAAALPVAHGLGRAAPGVLMWLLPSASEDGLAARYGARIARRQAVTAATIGAAVAVGIMGPWGVVAVIATAVAATIVGRLALRKIAGVTGDVLGAAEQLTEIGVLLLAASAGTGLPWWRG